MPYLCHAQHWLWQNVFVVCKKVVLQEYRRSRHLHWIFCYCAFTTAPHAWCGKLYFFKRKSEIYIYIQFIYIYIYIYMSSYIYIYRMSNSSQKSEDYLTAGMFYDVPIAQWLWIFTKYRLANCNNIPQPSCPERLLAPGRFAPASDRWTMTKNDKTLVAKIELDRLQSCCFTKPLTHNCWLFTSHMFSLYWFTATGSSLWGTCTVRGSPTSKSEK